MDDATIKLILDMGASGATVEDVTRKLENLKGSVHTTADTYEVLERQVGQYEVLERKATETVRAQVTMLDQLNIELNRQADLYQVVTAEAASVGRTMGRQGSFGSGMLQASFAVQDFTSVVGDGGLGRALASAQNNVPGLLMALGVGGGLAGVVSVVSVGVGLLVSNWDKLTGAWRDGETEREAERVKKLAKELENAKEQAEKLAKTLPRPQREEAGAVNKAIQEFGGAAVMKELSEALQARFGNFGQQANEQQAKNFMANLARGDGRALDLLKDLDLRGDIGEVLRGGPTPKERMDRARQADARQQKERDQHEKERKQEAERARKDAEKKAEEQAREDRAADERTRQMQGRIEQRGRREQARAAGARRREAMANAGAHAGDFDMGAVARAGLQNVEQRQRQVLEATGQRLTQTQAAQIILQERQQTQAAQREFLQAVIQATGGQGEQARMFREAARTIRQRNQPASNSGWN